ncbi:MAG: phosphatase PAP2 family protein [Desulfobacterales bacterium]|nr:phosphatase PAP2 family protein [Desulfobacterales bacterium]
MQRFSLKILAIFNLVVICLTFNPYSAQSSSDSIEDVGDWLQYLLPAAGFLGTFPADDPEGRIQWAKTMGSSVAITTVLKGMYGKMRPGNDSLTSFPSGHTTAAFAGAGFIDTRYGRAWGSLAYAGAVFTGYSRIYADRHFADDVLAGASIGLFNTWYWVTPHQSPVTVMPMAVENGMGVMVNLTDPDYTVEEKDKTNRGAEKLSYTVDFTSAFLLKNQISSPGSNGTVFDLDDFNKKNDPVATARAILNWSISEQYNLSLLFWPLEYRDSGRFNTDLSFNGTVFPADTDLESAYRNYRADLMFSQKLLLKAPWTLTAGLGISGQWTHVELSSNSGNLHTEVEETLILPMAGLNCSYNITSNWQISADATGIFFDSDHYLEGGLATRYDFNKRWDIRLGAKYFARKIESSELKEESEHAAFHFSVSHRFY